jgi:hypothetical protein
MIENPQKPWLQRRVYIKKQKNISLGPWNAEAQIFTSKFFGFEMDQTSAQKGNQPDDDDDDDDDDYDDKMMMIDYVCVFTRSLILTS